MMTELKKMLLFSAPKATNPISGAVGFHRAALLALAFVVG
jgi:hypothetical protein